SGFFFSSRRRHTRWPRDWSSDVCSSDLSGKREDELFHFLFVLVEVDVSHLLHPMRRIKSSVFQKTLIPSPLARGAGTRRHQCPQIRRASCRERVWSSTGWQTFNANAVPR